MMNSNKPRQTYSYNKGTPAPDNYASIRPNSRHEALRVIFFKAAGGISDMAEEEIAAVEALYAEELEDIEIAHVEAIAEAEREATERRRHLLKNRGATFCGWGSEAGVEIVEIIEDASCKTCIRLAQLSLPQQAGGEQHGPSK